MPGNSPGPHPGGFDKVDLRFLPFAFCALLSGPWAPSDGRKSKGTYERKERLDLLSFGVVSSAPSMLKVEQYGDEHGLCAKVTLFHEMFHNFQIDGKDKF